MLGICFKVTSVTRRVSPLAIHAKVEKKPAPCSFVLACKYHFTTAHENATHAFIIGIPPILKVH